MKVMYYRINYLNCIQMFSNIYVQKSFFIKKFNNNVFYFKTPNYELNEYIMEYKLKFQN